LILSPELFFPRAKKTASKYTTSPSCPEGSGNRPSSSVNGDNPLAEFLSKSVHRPRPAFFFFFFLCASEKAVARLGFRARGLQAWEILLKKPLSLEPGALKSISFYPCNTILIIAPWVHNYNHSCPVPIIIRAWARKAAEIACDATRPRPFEFRYIVMRQSGWPWGGALHPTRRPSDVNPAQTATPTISPRRSVISPFRTRVK